MVKWKSLFILFLGAAQAACIALTYHMADEKSKP